MFTVISKLHIWQSLYADTRFRVEIIQHKLNTQNGKFQVTFLVQTRRHILVHKRKSDNFILEKYGISYCTDEKRNRSAQSDP